MEKYFDILEDFIEGVNKTTTTGKKIHTIYRDEKGSYYSAICFDHFPVIVATRGSVNSPVSEEERIILVEDLAKQLLEECFKCGIHASHDFIIKHQEIYEKEKSDKKDRVVPFQLCPMCNGWGKIATPLATTTFSTCHVCNGSGVIPMCVLK